MAVEVTRNFDMAIRWSVDVENAMVSIQRLMEYADLPPEERGGQQPDQDGGADVTTDAERGQGPRGALEFESVLLRYKEGLAPALKELTFKIAPAQRIAVVGRTGAGKSSLF